MPRIPYCFGEYRAVEATDSDLAAIEAFWAESPEYLQITEARAPGSGDAAEFVHDAPPAGFHYRDHYNLLLRDAADRVDAVMSVATDLPAAGVWHLGLFVVATRLHGSGFARTAHDAFERWAHESGAEWLRLGVVAQNRRALRFWQRLGYAEMRRRAGVEMGALKHSVIMMMKPLTARPVAEYLASVPRDLPDAP